MNRWVKRAVSPQRVARLDDLTEPDWEDTDDVRAAKMRLQLFGDTILTPPNGWERWVSPARGTNTVPSAPWAAVDAIHEICTDLETILQQPRSADRTAEMIAYVDDTIAETGMQVRTSETWGGPECVPIDAEAERGRFDGWLLNEEIKRVRRSWEHKFGCAFTPHQVDTIIREHAIARLTRADNLELANHRRTLQQKESAKRSDRRRRACVAPRIRVALSPDEELLALLRECPALNIEELARQTGRRKEYVRKDIKRLEEHGQIISKKVGNTWHRNAVPDVSPHIRIEGTGIRVSTDAEPVSESPADAEPDVDTEHEAPRRWRRLRRPNV